MLFFEPQEGDQVLKHVSQALQTICRNAESNIMNSSVDTSDPTILHGLAREVFEETGLKLMRFIRGVGEGIEFTTGPRGRWMKLTFEIEIQGGADGAFFLLARQDVILDRILCWCELLTAQQRRLKLPWILSSESISGVFVRFQFLVLSMDTPLIASGDLQAPTQSNTDSGTNSGIKRTNG